MADATVLSTGLLQQYVCHVLHHPSNGVDHHKQTIPLSLPRSGSHKFSNTNMICLADHYYDMFGQ
jgi:hypothetical protein